MSDASWERYRRWRRSTAWLASLPEPLTRAEALRRRIPGARYVLLATTGGTALASLQGESPHDHSLCFVPRDVIEGPDEALRAHVTEHAYKGMGNLFAPLEPQPDAPEDWKEPT